MSAENDIKIDDMRAKSLVSALQSVRERVGKVAGGRDVCFVCASSFCSRVHSFYVRGKIEANVNE